MRAQPIEGVRIGTFEGRTGDQFAMANGKIELFVESAGYNEDLGESEVTIRLRKDHPVDEVRAEVTLPEFAWENLRDAIGELL